MLDTKKPIIDQKKIRAEMIRKNSKNIVQLQKTTNEKAPGEN